MQQLLVILIFLTAVGYLGWRAWKSLRRPQAGSCGKGCGCADDEHPAAGHRPRPSSVRKPLRG